jgi:hypothetical protein
MTCEAFQTLLHRDLDGVIAPEDATRLSDHLAGCGRCSEDRASLAAMRAAFRDLRQAEVPAGLGERIVRGAADRGSIFRIPRQALVPVAASILALCVVSGAVGWRLNSRWLSEAFPQVHADELRPRADEATYRDFLVNELALPPDRVAAIIEIRRDYDRRFESEKAALKARQETLHRDEIDAIWKLLPEDARQRYQRHDPSFTPPPSAPKATPR